MSPFEDRIPELLKRVDLDALVVRLGGIESKRSGGTSTYRCLNPGHEDRTPSFIVKGGRWKCWSACAASGDAIDLLVWLRGLTKAEAIEELAAMVGLERADTGPALPDRDLLTGWCRRRGWGPWVIDELALSLVEDRYRRPRIRFPYRLDGELITYQDRAVNDAVTLRWLTPRGGKSFPYEADRLCLAEDRDHRGHVFVVEGVTDVAAFVNVYSSPAVIGIPGVQAWRESWAPSFKGLGVFVIGDNDDAGKTFRSKVTADLQSVARAVWNVQVPDRFGDVAEWCRDLDAETFDDELMAAVRRADGTAAESAAQAVAPGGLRMAG